MDIKYKIVAKFLNRSDGLPSGQVQDITQDGNNVFWFAGPNGLTKYNGARVRVFHQKDGLATHGLRSVAVSKDGRVWIGSDIGVDLIEPDGQIHPLVGAGKWNRGFVQCIAVSTDDTVWLGTAEGLLKWTGGGGLQPVSDPRLNSGLINSLFISEKNKIWVGGKQCGLLKYDGRKWLSHESLAARETGTVLSIAGGGDTIFVGGEEGVVEIDRDGGVRRRLEVNDAEAVTAILNAEDKLWLGIGGQLRVYRAAGEVWQLEQVILENAVLNKLYLDSIGNIYGATDSFGVVKLSALQKAIVQPILPKTKAVFAIRQTPDQRFLLAGDQCSWRLDLEGDLTGESIEGLKGKKVWDILQDRTETIWAATEVGLYSLSQPTGEIRRVGAEDPVLSSPGRVLLEHRDSLWIGTVSGLAELKNSEHRQIKDADGQTLGYVYTLARDLGDNIWIGTLGNGLWRETGDGISKFSTREIKSFGNIYDIEIGKDGRMAVLQDNQIILLTARGDLINIIETEDSVAGWSALWLKDSLWVGSSSGLQEYEAESGRLLRRITALTGMAEWEFTTSRSLEPDQNGRLLCGLNGGLTIVDVDELNEFNETPPVKLDRLNWSNAVVEETAGGRYIVAPGKWKLDIEAYVPGFIDEDDTWVRFRLVGFDTSWLEYKKNAQIQYNSLPPGEYTVEAQAYIPLVGAGPVTRLFELQVRQPWWAKGWFAVPYAASEAILGLIEARWRNRRLLERNLRLEERVRVRTREIEAANTALKGLNRELQLISVTDPLTGIANRRQFNETLEKELRRGQRSQLYLSLILMDVDHFKAYNDNYGHPEGDACLRTVAHAMIKSFRSGGDLLARYGGEEFAAILPDTDAEGALAIAERARTTIADLGIRHEHSTAADFVTISLGVATFKFDEQTALSTETDRIKKKLILTADQALYAAKESGRNRVESSLVPED